MAKKVPKPANDAGGAQPGDDDLAVMHPERRFTLAGIRWTMREYGFVESIGLMPLLDPIIADLRQMLERGETLGGFEQYPACLGHHAEALVELMAIATDTDPELITVLSPADGDELIWWWWVVNGPFFVCSAGRRAALALAAKQWAAKQPRAGQTSTPSSSAPVTAPPPPSAT